MHEVIGSRWTEPFFLAAYHSDTMARSVRPTSDKADQAPRIRFSSSVLRYAAHAALNTAPSGTTPCVT